MNKKNIWSILKVILFLLPIILITTYYANSNIPDSHECVILNVEEDPEIFDLIDLTVNVTDISLVIEIKVGCCNKPCSDVIENENFNFNVNSTHLCYKYNSEWMFDYMPSHTLVTFGICVTSLLFTIICTDIIEYIKFQLYMKSLPQEQLENLIPESNETSSISES